jgi:hypothetical protein
MKRNLCIIESTVLTKRWEHYYCLDTLINYFNVTYLDCSSITQPSFHSTTEITSFYVVKVKSKKHLSTILKELPKDIIVVCNIHIYPANFWIHRIIASKTRHIIHVNFFTQNDTEHLSKFQKIIRKFEPERFVKILFWKMYSIMYDSITISCNPDVKRFRINHPDYEAYLQDSLSLSTESDLPPYIVYLDNFFPYHPEIEDRERNFYPKEIAGPFYESINKFFSRIESETGYSVIIAAHPTSSYPKNPFGGRKIFINKSSQLVKNARAVVMHTSNTLSLVVLYNKPVALLTNEFYQKATIEQRRLQTISERYRLPIIDTDDESKSFKDFSKMDETLRQEYILNLTDGENKCNAERFVDYYNKIYEEEFGSDVC